MIISIGALVALVAPGVAAMAVGATRSRSSSQGDNNNDKSRGESPTKRRRHKIGNKYMQNSAPRDLFFVLRSNPGVLIAWAMREHANNKASYVNPIVRLFRNANSQQLEDVEHLMINFIMSRRVSQQLNQAMLSDMYHIRCFVHVCEDVEQCTEDFATQWTQAIVNHLNTRMTTEFTHPPNFHFGGDVTPPGNPEGTLLSLDHYLLDADVARIARLLYSDAIIDGTLFQDEEAINELFVRVTPRIMSYFD